MSTNLKAFSITMMVLMAMMMLVIVQGRVTLQRSYPNPANSKMEDNNLDIIRNRNMLYLVGDSITQFSSTLDGFQSLLSNWYYAKVDLVNRGFSGYNTDLVRYMLENEFDQTFLNLPIQIDREMLVVFCMGANDACFPESPTKQHVPLDRYYENVQVIVEIMRKRLKKVNILLMTPPPMNATQYNENVGNGYRDNQHTGMYAQAIRDLVKHDKQGSMFLIDLWDEMNEWTTGHPYSDGLHMSPQGNQIMFKHIQTAIQKNFPQFDAVKIKDSFDPWYVALAKLHNETVNTVKL